MKFWAILYNVVLARNCLASKLDYIVMQMRKINREKGYFGNMEHYASYITRFITSCKRQQIDRVSHALSQVLHFPIELFMKLE